MRFILPTYLKVAVIIAMFKQTKRRYDLNSGGDILFVLKVERRVHINFSFVSIENIVLGISARGYFYG